MERVGVGTLAGEEQRAEIAEVVFPDGLAVRVLALDGAEGGRRGEHRADLMVGDHAPEDAGVRRADRLALEHDRGAAMEQRRVDDIGVTDHPADVRGRPVDLARLDAVDVAHRPFERSEEHTSELPSLMRISYAVFCLNKKKTQ